MIVKTRTTKTLVYIALVILLAGLLSACNAKDEAMDSPQVTTSNESVMGTALLQKIYGPKGQAVIDETFNRMKYLEGLLTFNAPEGDVHKVNEKAGIESVKLDPITVNIIKKSIEVAERSNGAFDVTIGPLVKSWGIGTEMQRVPTQKEINQLLPLVNYKDIQIDGQWVGLRKPGQMMDLGGIAKGYAGDEAIAIYKKHGIKSGFVSLGGNVVCLGGKPDGSPWTVGIRNPRSADSIGGKEIIGTIEVKDKAVTAAGDDQRYFMKNGQRYFHILNPHTGYPAETDLMSVTLISDSSLESDAYDTAVFILGLEKGMELVKQLGMDAVFITKNKKIYITEGLKENFKLLDNNSEYELAN